MDKINVFSGFDQDSEQFFMSTNYKVNLFVSKIKQKSNQTTRFSIHFEYLSDKKTKPKSDLFYFFSIFAFTGKIVMLLGI